MMIEILPNRSDYIHYNPVRHRLCSVPEDWKFSTIHRLIAGGVYPPNWGMGEIPEKPESIWDI
ncbi:hypothetical protein [Scytonema sp. UIC 10036]|uniref:hypothetical protein n=1 Tax=Scytonema sp. UIC 10036 TaxID=2304196 RepID=UPI001A9A6F9D|nr:hypothetical protein [Scytonema sp. UIC 10036]